MPFICPKNLNIHYELSGAGDVALVLVHGNFASWRWWRPVMERLPAGYRAYTPELRGCGDSDHPSGGYSISQLAADLGDFAAALSLPAFHLVGHSLGGAVAMQFALEHASAVQSLTLVAPAPAEGMPFIRAANSDLPLLSRLFGLERDASLATLDAIYRFLRALDANRLPLRQALMRMMPTLAYDRAFDALVDDAARMAPEAVIGYLRALDEWNIQSSLHRLQMPVLIVWGEKDILVPRTALERTASGFGRGQLVIWPDVGHSPQLEQADRFTRLLLDFVTMHQPRQPWWSRLRLLLRASSAQAATRL
jgi:branched-chain amino acid transport system permease protein